MSEEGAGSKVELGSLAFTHGLNLFIDSLHSHNRSQYFLKYCTSSFLSTLHILVHLIIQQLLFFFIFFFNFSFLFMFPSMA